MMNLTVFQSDKGDCLLLSSDRRNVLIDGGMRASYTEHVAPTLDRLRRGGEQLDLVYVSHIDQDHVSGVLQLLDDLVDWQVHEFQRDNGNASHPKPESRRPPEVAEIWHNAFHEQIGRNAGPVEDLLAAVAALLRGADESRVHDNASLASDLAASVREAIQVSRRVGAGQLGIALNRPAGGKLILVRDSQAAVQLGTLSISVIGPFPQDLRKLRTQWNKWLRENRQALAEIREQAREDEGHLTESEIDRVVRPMLTEARLLGERENVTAPNLASLMLLVEQDGKSILLTGDGHHEDILKGLQRAGKLDASGGVHVNVLKVQQHGSEHNMDAAFCKAVTADHYVFCGNGAHENPDPDIVELIIDSRIGPEEARSRNSQVDDRFTLWFNSSSRATRDSPKNRRHMAALERLVRRRAARSNGRMRRRFLRGHKLTLTI